MKKMKFVLCLAMSVGFLAGCSNKLEVNGEWESNSLAHWHIAKIGDKELMSDYSEHTFDENNNCTVCNYHKTLPTISDLIGGGPGGTARSDDDTKTYIYIDLCNGSTPQRYFCTYQEMNANELVGLNRDGYVFRGFYLDKNYTQPLSETETTVLEGGSTIYAKWDSIPEGRYAIPNSQEINTDFGPREETSFQTYAEVPYYVKEVKIKYIMSAHTSEGMAFFKVFGENPKTGVHEQLVSDASNRGHPVSHDVTLDLSKTKTLSLQYAFFNCYDPFYYTYFSIISYRKQLIKLNLK